jgi:hypothetical protein
MSRDWFEGWNGQYKRMIRFHDRAKQSLQGNDENEIYDFIYAFFQNCYHLRDWVVSGGVATKDEMKYLFDNNTELKLCRDICNATKHLQYDKPSIDPRPRISREWNPFKNEAADFYLYSDKRRSITELMSSCVVAWDEFLANKGLNRT